MNILARKSVNLNLDKFGEILNVHIRYMTKYGHICLPFVQQIISQFSIMMSSFRSGLYGAVMEARSYDERHQTLIRFKWREERPAVISPKYCLIASLAQLFPQHPVGRYVGLHVWTDELL